MLLETIKGTENIPVGGVKLTKEEATDHQRKIVESWPILNEVFFLRFGHYMSTAATLVTSVVCVNVFYPVLKFGTGTLTAVLPSTILSPSLIMYKTKAATDDILTLSVDCPLCAHTKYLALHIYGGLAFPALMGMLSLSESQGISSVQKDGKEYWRRAFKIAQAKHGIFRNVFMLHLGLSFLIPYLQHYEIAELMKKLSEKPVPQVSEEMLQV